MDSDTPSNSNVQISQLLDIPFGFPVDLYLCHVGDDTYNAFYSDDYSSLYAILRIKERKLNGLCEFYEDGAICERVAYVNNKKHGLCCYYHDDQLVRVCMYENGEQKEYLSVDNNFSSTFNSMIGKRILFSIHFSDINSLNAIRFNYEHEELSSVYVYENGAMKFVRYKFRYDQMLEYSEQNKLVYIGEFAISESTVYRNGKGKEYDEYDRIVYDGEWKNNKRHGKGTFYNHKDGEIKGDWNNGELIGGRIVEPSYSDGESLIHKSAIVVMDDECNIHLQSHQNSSSNLTGNKNNSAIDLNSYIFVNDHLGCRVTRRRLLEFILFIVVLLLIGLLAHIVNRDINCPYVLDAPRGSKNLTIPSGVCGAERILFLNLKRFKSLTTLIIEDNNFPNVSLLDLSVVPSLRKLVIGERCFSGMKSFSVSNHSLHSMTIHADSFESVRSFSLSSLSSLKELRISDSFTNPGLVVSLDSLASLSELSLDRKTFANAHVLSMVHVDSLRELSFVTGFGKGVGRVNLEGFPSLTSLHFGQSSFISTDGMVLFELPSLESVVIGKYSLNKVKEFSLSSFKCLKRVEIDSGSLTSSSLVFSLKDLPSLVSLILNPSLNYSQIYLNNLPSLSVLSFPEYCAEFSSKLVITSCSSLKRIEFLGNNFNSMTDFSFNGLVSLQSLVIGNSTLTSLEQFYLDSLPSLSSVLFGWNSLNSKDLKVVFSNLPQLSSVVLGQYLIRPRSIVFSNLPLIKELVFPSHSMTSTTELTIQSCSSLQLLLFNGYNFQGVSSFILKDLPSLTRIRVGPSSFTSLSYLSLISLPSLTTFSVELNSLTSSSLTLRLEDLSSLSTLSWGGLIDHALSIILKNLQSLERLVFPSGMSSSSLVIDSCSSLKELSFMNRTFADNTLFTLSNVDKLEKVIIGKNSFTSISDISLVSLQSLVNVTVESGSLISSRLSFTLDDLPSLKVLSLSSSICHAKSVKLLHLSIVSLVFPSGFSSLYVEIESTSLKHMIVQRNSFVTTTQFILNSASLTNMTVGSGSFNSLLNLDLTRITNVNTITIHSNSFNFMNQLLVSDLHSLTSLSIGSNSFNTVRQFTLSSLPALSTLSIGSNSLSSNQIEFKLQNLPSLNSLSFDNTLNNAKSIGLFNVSLYNIAFPSNVSANILTIRECSNLEELVFDSNSFKTTTEVNLSSYSLHTITIGTECFNSLNQFNLNSLISLTSLTIGSNSLNVLNNFNFTGLTNLTSLMIGSKSLTRLNNFSLSGLVHLTSLSIGSECFNSLNQFNLNSLVSLSSLSIGSNSFNTVRQFTLSSLPALSTLSIGSNSLSSNQIEFKLQNLPSLNSLSFDNTLNNAKSIRLLNVSIEVLSFPYHCASSARLLELSSSSLKELTFSGDNFNNATSLILSTEALVYLTVGSHCFKNNLLVFTLSGYQYLSRVSIGHMSFLHVDNTTFTHLPNVRSIAIGSESFNKVPDWRDYKEPREYVRKLEVSDCSRLTNFTAEVGSFADYGGGFILKSRSI